MRDDTPAQDPDRDHRQCDGALARAFGFLGKRWNGMILSILADGPVGFSEIARTAGGVSASVLSDRLSELAAAGLLVRVVNDTRPPTVDYTLTPAGIALLPVLNQLGQWASEHLADHDACLAAADSDMCDGVDQPAEPLDETAPAPVS